MLSSEPQLNPLERAAGPHVRSVCVISSPVFQHHRASKKPRGSVHRAGPTTISECTPTACSKTVGTCIASPEPSPRAAAHTARRARLQVLNRAARWKASYSVINCRTASATTAPLAAGCARFVRSASTRWRARRATRRCGGTSQRNTPPSRFVRGRRAPLVTMPALRKCAQCPAH